MENLVEAASNNNNQDKPETTQWADIPGDVLSLILSYLYVGDEATFRCVCKTWQSISKPPNPKALPCPFDYLHSPAAPWLGWFDNTGICKFFHPIHNDTYNYTEISREIFSTEISHSQIWCSGGGWLLLQQDLYHSFFLHLSTRQRIDLPMLPTQLNLLTFFTCPGPHYCVVIGIGVDTSVVYTYKMGGDGHHDEWKRYAVADSVPFQFQTPHCSPVCHHGRFYCVDSKGCLIEFDANDDISQSFTYTMVDFELPHRQQVAQTFMLVKEEEEEELLVVILTRNDLLYVYRWDKEEKKLAWVESLGDYVLFISRAGSFADKATIRGTNNKIFSPTFFYKKGSYAFYSLATMSYHSFFSNDDSRIDYLQITHRPNSFWFRPMLGM